MNCNCPKCNPEKYEGFLGRGQYPSCTKELIEEFENRIRELEERVEKLERNQFSY